MSKQGAKKQKVDKDKSNDASADPEVVKSSDSDDDHVLDQKLLLEELKMREEREHEDDDEEKEEEEEEEDEEDEDEQENKPKSKSRAWKRNEDPEYNPANDSDEEDGRKRRNRARNVIDPTREAQRKREKAAKLDNLLMQTNKYSEFLVENLQSAMAEVEREEAEIRIKAEAEAELAAVEEAPASGRKKRGSRKDANISPTKPGETVDLKSARVQSALQRHFCPLVTGGELKDYQIKGVAWLISLYNNGMSGILADQMGLGKTLQTIAFLSYLRSQGLNGPFLIVGPLSTLSNWVAEVRRWTPSIPVLLYHGSPPDRQTLRAQQMPAFEGKCPPTWPIVVTSFEVVMRDRAVLQRYKWKYIAVDEGHRLKNKDCRLLRELAMLRGRDDEQCRLLLTGTPLQNNLQELWSLLNFLLPDIFSNVDDFNDWFDFAGSLQAEAEGGNAENGGDPEAEARASAQTRVMIVSKLQSILRPFMLRRIKTDVLTSLPPKKEIVLYAPMTKVQRDMMKGLRDRTLQQQLAELSRGVTGARTALNNTLMQMRKACNHPDLITGGMDGSILYPSAEELREHGGKFALLERLLTALRKDNRKVLIFSQMARMLDLLQHYFDEEGVEVRRLDGSTDWQDRQRYIAEFNEDPNVECFLLTTRAGGLGINLTSADTVVIFDSDWNPHADFQAMDRCHRIGQTKPVLVFRLVTSHSVEGKMLEKANSKLALERLVVKKSDLHPMDQVEKRKKEKAEADRLLEEEQKSKLTEEELQELLQVDYNMDDACQSKAVSDAMLAKLLDRDHMAEGRAAPYEGRGVGYEVITRAASSLLAAIE